ncbi:hypothetical protein JST99_02165 [Candidatus Dependentiae bacterium]|nr:hypothetical protein [Candidatus Dependentiae bacterium]MCC7415482.1 hypothetical protein [Campylobacterota bacterium]
MKVLLKICMASVIAANIEAACSELVSPFIISPKLEETVSTPTPIIIGMAIDNKGRPIKKGRVSVYVDKHLAAIIETNEYGVWSYAIDKDHALCDGFHSIDASIKPKIGSLMWTQSSLFYVQATHLPAQDLCATAYVPYSNIKYPFDGSYINNKKPVIVGQLLSADYTPIAHQAVIIKINELPEVVTTSDKNGLFFYRPDLSHGLYTVRAYCLSCDTEIITSFEIDVTAPQQPTIITPQEGSLITDGVVIVSGYSQSYATITTFLDTDTFGKITHSNGQGYWSTKYSVEDGSHAVTARATDRAGNTSALSPAVTFRAQERMS